MTSSTTKKKYRRQRRHGEHQSGGDHRLLARRPGDLGHLDPHFQGEFRATVPNATLATLPITGTSGSIIAVIPPPREAAIPPWREPVGAGGCMLAGVEGLEPPTSGFGDRRSSQLSYTPSGPPRPFGHAGPHQRPDRGVPHPKTPGDGSAGRHGRGRKKGRARREVKRHDRVPAQHFRGIGVNSVSFAFMTKSPKSISIPSATPFSQYRIAAS